MGAPFTLCVQRGATVINWILTIRAGVWTTGSRPMDKLKETWETSKKSNESIVIESVDSISRDTPI